MPKLTFVGSERTQAVEYLPGDALMTVAVRNMIVGIEAQCGGSAACGTCVVDVPAPWQSAFPPMADDERDMLDAVAEGRPGARLSCQLILAAGHDGLDVSMIEAM